LVTLKLLAMLATLGTAAVTDLRERRIPNRVTVLGAGAALALAAAETGGLPTAALLGLGAALLVTFPLFALGALGAGDAKLAAVVGAFLGLDGLLPAALYAGLAGGLLGLASAVRRGVIVPVLLETGHRMAYLATLGRRGARVTIHDPDARTIPYGVAIAAGALMAWFLPLFPGGAP
ncbi:MAG: prepilin peptidase, partial [Longimicrobiales bacterium]|nr:prepilin peptidase [Longimicrobiales bacterium]